VPADPGLWRQSREHPLCNFSVNPSAQLPGSAVPAEISPGPWGTFPISANLNKDPVAFSSGWILPDRVRSPATGPKSSSARDEVR
jgi:hypothetical protein